MRKSPVRRIPVLPILTSALCLQVLVLSSPAAGADAPPLSSIRELRDLTPEQARAERPVRIQGYVTYSKPSIANLFIHDGTGGVFVDQSPGPDSEGPAAGDLVEVTGVSGEGMFAPVIKGPGNQSAQLKLLRHGTAPEPRMITGDELSRPDADSEWIAIEAWVAEILTRDGDMILVCRAGTCEFHILLEGPLPPESLPWDLAESRIVAKGVVATTFNRGRQMTGRFLRVGSLADITPIERNLNPSQQPRLVRAEELMRAGGAGPDELVRIRGVATLAMPGRGLFLKVDGGGLWVQTAQPVAAAPGTLIEVLGWPRPGEMKPFIRARRVSVIGSTTPPKPLPFKASEALKAHHDATWLSVEAELLDSFNGPDGTTLELRDTDTVFRGLIPSNSKLRMADLEPGSRLRITGVSRITPARNLILRVEDKLMILAGSANDVELLARPPFWTARSVSILAATVIAGLFAVIAIARSRKRREQETQRREFEAVLAERGRFAREIHDSLAQGLTSISLQLECVRDQLANNPAAAADHLEKARGFVRDSLREARRTVWNLRPLALGEADLASTLQIHASHLSDSGKITCSQQIEGTPRPLPPDHETALLRIGQEALTNAARHSAATEIRHRLRYGNGWVTLSVMDNGRGFDVSTKVGKGFGLISMHERVAALGGSLSIDSRNGHGSEVSATLPA
jgi:signal transduction histidine kinase